MDTAAARNTALDGLRGWAALSVTGYHFYWETFGVRFPQMRNPLVAVLINGHLTVAIFFVLSGYVLTVNRWFRPVPATAWTLFLKRYARLAIPVLGGSAIVLSLVLLGATANAEAGRIVGKPDWLGSWAGPSTTWEALFQFSTVGIFLDDFTGGYGPFLWTMTIELWGSVLVLGVCLLQSRLRMPGAVLALFAALALLINPPWAGFFVGALVSYADRDGRLRFVLTAPVAAALVVFVLLVGGFVSFAGHVTEADDLTQHLICAFAAPLLVIAALRSAVLGRLLSAPLSQLLGRLSFSLYIVHFAVLISITSLLIVIADRAGLLSLWSAVAIASLSMLISLIAAALFMPVDRLTGWVGRAIDSVWPQRSRSEVVLA